MIAIRRHAFTVLCGVLARLRQLRHANHGSVATEYGLIAALIVAVVIVALTQVRTGLLSLPFPSLIAAFNGALGS